MAYSDTEIQDKATQLIQAGVGEDDVRSFINTAKAEQGVNQATPDNPDINPVKEGIMGGLAAASPFPLKGTAETALRVGAPAVGQMIGGPIGGAIGGGLGEAGAQALEGEFKPGQILASAGLGAIPGSSLAKAGVGGVVKEGVKFGLGNLAAKTVETGIDEGRLPSMPEAALSFAGGAIAAPIAKGLDKGANALQQRSVEKQLQNAIRDKTLKEAADAGYVVLPSQINPTKINKMIEGFAGRPTTLFEAGVRKQEITNALAKKAIGVPAEAPLTQEVLQDVKAELYGPYKEIAAISPQAKKQLQDLKDARWMANKRYQQYNVDKNPDTLKLAKDAEMNAAKGELALSRTARAAGRPDLLPALRDARTTLAKVGVVERALIDDTGNVSASKLAQAKGRLTDELDLIKRFQRISVGYPGGGAAPIPPLGGKFDFLRGPVRSLTLSRFGQKLLANPRYSSTPDVQAILARFGAMDASRAPSLPQPSQ